MNPSTRTSHFLFSQWWVWGRVALVLGLLLVIPEASAVFTFTNTYSTPKKIVLTVGSTGGIVNKVNFDVSGTVLSPNPVAVTGVPSVTTGGVSNGVLVEINTQRPYSPQNLFLTMTSPAALSCVSGSGCGSTVIPFDTISWKSYNQDTAYDLDINDGVFPAAGGQTQLIGVRISGWNDMTVSNTLVFQYANTTLYPAGQYSGQVTYTASMP